MNLERLIGPSCGRLGPREAVNLRWCGPVVVLAENVTRNSRDLVSEGIGPDFHDDLHKGLRDAWRSQARVVAGDNDLELVTSKPQSLAFQVESLTRESKSFRRQIKSPPSSTYRVRHGRFLYLAEYVG